MGVLTEIVWVGLPLPPELVLDPTAHIKPPHMAMPRTTTEIPTIMAMFRPLWLGGAPTIWGAELKVGPVEEAPKPGLFDGVPNPGAVFGEPPNPAGDPKPGEDGGVPNPPEVGPKPEEGGGWR